MITQQEINTYVKSQEKFQLECERVCSILMLFNSIYKFVIKFEIKDNLVKCGCEIDDNYTKWYVTFPIEFLEKSNKELKQYVDKLIKEKEEQEQEEVKNQETEDVI